MQDLSGISSHIFSRLSGLNKARWPFGWNHKFCDFHPRISRICDSEAVFKTWGCDAKAEIYVDFIKKRILWAFCIEKSCISARNARIFVAPQVGLEPTTLRLTAECSAIELLRHAACSADKRYYSIKTPVCQAISAFEEEFSMQKSFFAAARFVRTRATFLCKHHNTSPRFN